MEELIKKCVDIGQWKHSWHNPFKDLNDYERARDVINKNIEKRTQELPLLNEGLNRIDCMIAKEREQSK